MKGIHTLFFLLLLFSTAASAHVNTPVDLELSVYQDGRYEMDATGHIESILSGATSTASLGVREVRDEYERLEAASDADLRDEFYLHQKRLTRRLKLFLNDKPVELKLKGLTLSGHNGSTEGRLGTVTYAGDIGEPIKTVNFGYSRSLGFVMFKYRHMNPETGQWSDWQLLSNIPGEQPANQSVDVQAAQPQSLGQNILAYLYLGFTHILPKGLDHILFILGLFLLSIRWRPLLLQVTAFTLAHTLTLGLAMKDIVTAPSSLVEPLIAFSIAYIAIENIFGRNLGKIRLVIVFLFGLLHGLGFASVLTELGVPEGRFLSSLISFNVGVELGQITVLTIAFLLLGIPFGKRPWYRNRITIPLSAAIALTGLYWGIERSVGALT